MRNISNHLARYISFMLLLLLAQFNEKCNEPKLSKLYMSFNSSLGHHINWFRLILPFSVIIDHYYGFHGWAGFENSQFSRSLSFNGL